MKMGGHPSHGMVLCASDAEHKTIEVLRPPPGSKPGDVISIEGLPRNPIPDINLSKKKNPWERVEPKTTTTDDLCVASEGKNWTTSLGPIKAATLKAAKIS